MASLRASDTVLPAITALSKDNHGGVLVSDIEQGTFRFTADHVQKLGPSSPPVISMAETADGKVWLGTLGDGLFFLTGGRATHVNAGLPDRKINSLLPIGEELWVGTDTGLYHGNGNRLSSARIAVVPRQCPGFEPPARS